jgi:hypothetical protein
MPISLDSCAAHGVLTCPPHSRLQLALLAIRTRRVAFPRVAALDVM